MVCETFRALGFLNIRLGTILWDTKDLALILYLAPLQRSLRNASTRIRIQSEKIAEVMDNFRKERYYP